MATEFPKEPQAGLLGQVQHYWHVILKWKWTAGGFLVLAVVAATAYSLLVPPVYTASGSVWIEDDPNILPFEDVQSFGAGSNLQSHVRLLQSRTLAADIIEKMKLYENPDFAGKPKKGAEAPGSRGSDIPRSSLSRASSRISAFPSASGPGSSMSDSATAIRSWPPTS